jgi:hypothetical protein
MTGNLLTEGEVAERLRCAKTKVKRLRLSGKLAYIAGRPPLIDEKDLETYIASARRVAVPQESPPPKPQPTASAYSNNIYTRVLQKRLKLESRQRARRKKQDGAG